MDWLPSATLPKHFRRSADTGLEERVRGGSRSGTGNHMRPIHLSRRFVVVALVLAAGCEAKKSSNPLSPTVAGPIPGVVISAPVLIEPAQGFKFKVSQQPI